MPKPMMIGEQVFDAARAEAMGKSSQRWDRSYVPGYSEARQANEIRVREGKAPIDIDRLQWIRVSKTDGRETDLRDRGEFARLGYQYAMKEDLQERGWGLPPTAYVAPDGTIRREDSALMIVDKRQARINREERAREAAEFYGREHDPDEFAPEGVGLAPGNKQERINLDTLGEIKDPRD